MKSQLIGFLVPAFASILCSASAVGQSVTTLPSPDYSPPTTITSFLVRPYGVHVVLAAPLTAAGCNSSVKSLPLILATDPAYKALRESVQLGVLTGKQLVVYVDRCALFSANSDYNYPVVYGIDVKP